MRRALPLLVLLWGAPVAAQEECEAKDPTTAEVNAREGVRLAKEGRFEEAVPLFRVAVRLDPCAPAHELLLARGLARLDERQEAQERYEAVIHRWPESPSAERARRELEELKRKPPPEPDPPEAQQPTAAKRVTPEKKRPPWMVIGAITAGVGAAFIGGGIAFALDAQEADDALDEASQQPDRGRYDELVDQRDSSSTLAFVFYGVGGALVAGGATMAALDYLVPPDDGAADGSTLGFAPTPGGLQVQIGGRF